MKRLLPDEITRTYFLLFDDSVDFFGSVCAGGKWQQLSFFHHGKYGVCKVCFRVHLLFYYLRLKAAGYLLKHCPFKTMLTLDAAHFPVRIGIQDSQVLGRKNEYSFYFQVVEWLVDYLHLMPSKKWNGDLIIFTRSSY